MNVLENKDKLELAFKESLAEVLPNKSLYVTFFDINSLKQVNDVFGHLMGDLVVRTCVSKILNNMRDSDRLICFGGDEFILFMPNFSETRIKTLLEKVQLEIKNDPVLLEKIGGSSIAMGVVKYSKKLHKNLDGVLAAADDLMYKAKAKPPKFLVCKPNYTHEERRVLDDNFSPEVNRKRAYFSWISSYVLKEHPTYDAKTVLEIMRHLWRIHKNGILLIPPQKILEDVNMYYTCDNYWGFTGGEIK